MKTSVNKRCPFRKGSCIGECALYDSESICKCSFLETIVSLDNIAENLWILIKKQEQILKMLNKNNDE